MALNNCVGRGSRVSDQKGDGSVYRTPLSVLITDGRDVKLLERKHLNDTIT